MKSLDVANRIIDRYGSEFTNPRLNRLVYFTQVLALRQTGRPLFDDDIRAWDCGPVEPLVHHRFHRYGNGCIPAHDPYEHESRMEGIVETVMTRLGWLTTFDLVRLTHREGSAWRQAYRPGEDVRITDRMILESTDPTVFDATGLGRTLAEGIAEVDRTWPNALRMLADS